MNRKIMHGLVAAALTVGVAAVAFADPTPITAQDIYDGNTGAITFTATGGALGLKTLAGVTGVGVTGGASGNEIDLGQSITASSSSGFTLRSVTLAFLFDGPEYNDYEEVASLTGYFKSGGSSSAHVVNIYTNPTDNDLNLYIDGTLNNSLILSATEATDTTAGEVTLGPIFGNGWLSDLDFTALEATGCGVSPCTNQSDYSIESITAVPEPGVLAMFGLGLLGLAFALRRRSNH
ncbi:MAG TPA: PEP-CTERM sorting domain-containing protein [Gammaproteobacteria bacterium]|nr:PEP-CTERM sorting domain-containing protein [Gammaproteobacteria bacterium]HET7370838.1 PEP-CTERM sorting domain-containing protein [Gammaproteobacteria bacterium]